jgi:beta-N-acetylhexosaminidase
MRRVGHLYDEAPDAGTDMATTCGWLIGAELRALGIDLCFAPCVDLDYGISEVIGDRAFHSQPEAVAVLAGAFCRGLREAGMAAVAKHFPGHGAVVADSHEQLPIDRRAYGDLLDDMRPYEALISQRKIAAVMLAHVVYDTLDRSPAGFSAYWIREQLRGRLGFDGAIFCDDLSMRATAGYGSMSQRAKLALAAGCDMLLVCNDRTAAQHAVSALGDHSDPLSLVRLARLHGTGAVQRETLLASDTWQEAAGRVNQWLDRPDLELNA